MIIQLTELTGLEEIDSGGQGTVHGVDKRVGALIGWHHPLVAKLYGSTPRPPRGALGALRERVEWLRSLSARDRDELLSAAAWPLAVIQNGNSLAGIVMPDQRPNYNATMFLPSGGSDVLLGKLEHALEDDAYLQRRFHIAIDRRARIALCERLATTTAVLHRHSIVASDISQANTLIRLDEPHSVAFIDCDSMLFHGTAALKPVETPGWEMPPAWQEDPTSRSADGYKLGLAILRIFAADQSVRELAPVEADVPPELHASLRAALAKRPDLRPAAGSWQAELRILFEKSPPSRATVRLAAVPTPTVRPIPVRSTPTATAPNVPGTRPRPVPGRRPARRSRRILALGLTALLGVGIAVAILDSGRQSPSTNATQTSTTAVGGSSNKGSTRPSHSRTTVSTGSTSAAHSRTTTSTASRPSNVSNSSGPAQGQAGSGSSSASSGAGTRPKRKGGGGNTTTSDGLQGGAGGGGGGASSSGGGGLSGGAGGGGGGASSSGGGGLSGGAGGGGGGASSSGGGGLSGGAGP